MPFGMIDGKIQIELGEKVWWTKKTVERKLFPVTFWRVKKLNVFVYWTNQTFIWLETEFLVTNHESTSKQKIVKTNEMAFVCRFFSETINIQNTVFTEMGVNRGGRRMKYGSACKSVFKKAFSFESIQRVSERELNKHPIKWYALLSGQCVIKMMRFFACDWVYRSTR